MTSNRPVSGETFATFGGYLRFLRRRARLTQRELAIAVNYSEGQICHLEHDRRTPDLTTVVALFVPALHLEDAPDETARLLALAATVTPEPPPVESVNRRNLPAPTPLIGRAAQRTQLEGLLVSPEVRLVTLIGPPGVGKTHLALQLARDLHDRFRDGVHFVDLSTITEVQLVAPAIMLALGIAEDPRREAIAALESALSEQQILLLLDNVEQIADLAGLLPGLLAAAPGVTLLLTSRIALRLQIERIYNLPPLAVPDLRRLPPNDELARIESVALLLERLRAVNPDLTLTVANALALAAICVRVDGLPLAIELVASRGRLFEPQELLSEVTQHFRQLRRRGRDIPERHQTLAAALAWSYDQLTPGARVLFARLSVFVGKWRIDAVDAVCDLEQAGRSTMLDRLEELIEHSMVQRQSIEGVTFLSMLAMVHTYAQERLNERGEDEIVRQRLLQACIEQAEQAEEHLLFSSEQAAWMAWMEAEYDTLRVVLGWAQAAGANAQGLRLAGALWRFWYMRGMLREGRRWLEIFLTQPLDGNHVARAHALDGLGILAWRQGEYEQSNIWLHAALDLYRTERHRRGEARVLNHIGLLQIESATIDAALPFYEASLPIYRELGDTVGMAAVLQNMGNLYCQQNQNDRAMELYNECLAIYREHGSQGDIALVSLGIGVIARDQGQLAEAHAAFFQSLELARTLGDSWTVATALMNLGLIACDRGENVAAVEAFREAQTLFEQLGDQSQVAVVQSRLGTVAFLNGDRAAAVGQFRQCLMLSNAMGYQPGIVTGLEGMAGCAAEAQPLLATRLFAAGAALRETLQLPIPLADQPRHDQIVQQIRRGSEPSAWAVAWEEGRRMTAAQAIAMALAQIV